MTYASEQGVLAAQLNAATEQGILHREQMRPFYLLRPRMFPDGDMWSALYGENLQEGVAGFGETPDKATYDFDKNWYSQRLLQSQGQGGGE